MRGVAKELVFFFAKVRSTGLDFVTLRGPVS